MRERTAPAGRAFGVSLEEALARPVRLSWEGAGYLAAVALGAGLRLWDLGSRALHHDESLHAFYSWLLYRDGVYEHMPMMHGPLKFFLTALSYFLFGVSDVTARLPYALVGVALLVLPVLLRPYLGRAGALATSFLLALSPVLLYFSRFARDDALVAFLTVGMVVCFWRYLDEGRPRYLYGLAFLLSLSFSTMENTFLHLAIFLLFLDFWLAFVYWEQVTPAHGQRSPRRVLGLPLLVAGAWAVAALWPLLRPWRERLGLVRWHPAGDLLVLMGTLSLPLFAAAVQVPLAWLGVRDRDLAQVAWESPWGVITREQVLGWATSLALLAAGAAVGVAWRRQWWPLALAFWAPYILLYTSFFTNLAGLATGVWGSVDYWLAQHDVRRGAQPDFYYLVLLPAYEFLALAVAGPALLYYCLRGGPRSWLLTAVTVLGLLLFFAARGGPPPGQGQLAFLVPLSALALFLAVQGSMWERFLVFWLAGAIFAYSLTGEKMPWLSVHMALPLSLLAGHTLGRLLPRAAVSLRGFLLPLAVALLWGGIALLAAFGPEEWSTAKLALLALGAGSLAALAFRRGLATAVLVALVPLFALSVRTGIVASFRYGDVPREMLVYTQTSPWLPDVVERIDDYARQTGLGRDLPIVIDVTDASYAWPWHWYLRDYHDVRYQRLGEGFVPPAGAVVVVAVERDYLMERYRERYDPPYRFPLRWWFPEVYRRLEQGGLGQSLVALGRDAVEPSTWGNWWRYMKDRVPPAPVSAERGQDDRCPWCGSVDLLAYFPRDGATQGARWQEGEVPLLSLSAPAPILGIVRSLRGEG